MNILVSESSRAMGGQELAVLLHAEGLVKRGHDLRLILEPGSPICELATRKDLPVETVPMGHLRYPSAIVAFRRLFRRYRPDVLHMNSSRDSWIGAISARTVRPRPALVRSRHISTPLNRNLPTRTLYRRLLDRIIVTGGELTRRGLIERDGLAPDQVVAFPIGIDIAEFRPAPPTHPLQQELLLGANHRLVGLISYLRGYKGHEYFIEAAALVLRQVNAVTFLIVGEGPAEATIKSWIAQAGLTQHVRMLGYRPDLLNVFRSLHLFVMPSVEADTIPQVLMQAMAIGLPVIATTVGSIPDVVLHEQTGLIVPPRNARALAEAMVRMLTDRVFAQRLGSAARQLVEQEYSLDRMLDRLESVYSDLHQRRMAVARS